MECLAPSESFTTHSWDDESFYTADGEGEGVGGGGGRGSFHAAKLDTMKRQTSNSSFTLSTAFDDSIEASMSSTQQVVAEGSGAASVPPGTGAAWWLEWETFNIFPDSDDRWPTLDNDYCKAFREEEPVLTWGDVAVRSDPSSCEASCEGADEPDPDAGGDVESKGKIIVSL